MIAYKQRVMDMDKLTMVHDWAMNCLKSGLTAPMEDLVAEAWNYADKMQAEAEKRNYSEKQDGSEWQPDWSQAPNDAKYWAMDADNSANFFKREPEITNGNGWDFGGVMKSDKGHDYQGNWQDSLRKRPQGI